MTRVERVLDQLVERTLDALLVTERVNVRYLTGFTGTSGLVLLSPARRMFVTDFRYVEQAAEQVPDLERLRSELGGE